ncbi:DoxX family protein [Thalassoporum mexicanum]|uniref:DoxX family protein n=1 Tax=Thalassoporum mexicanum TaxID=3457544 RepID=UPI0005A12C00|nr:DoxX family protein [Pseudanabaena sp. PCC 7367]
MQSSQPLRLLKTIISPELKDNPALPIALTVLRVAVGIFMVHNGLDKLADIEGFAAAYVEVIGLPFPIFFSYVAAFTELLGAPLLALGLFTRPAALGLMGTMLVAMYHHILVAGLSLPYLELSGVYASVFAFFLVNGAGKFSVDRFLNAWLGKLIANRTLRRLESLETSYQASDAEVTEVESTSK